MPWVLAHGCKNHVRPRVALPMIYHMMVVLGRLPNFLAPVGGSASATHFFQRGGASIEILTTRRRRSLFLWASFFSGRVFARTASPSGPPTAWAPGKKEKQRQRALIFFAQGGGAGAQSSIVVLPEPPSRAQLPARTHGLKGSGFVRPFWSPQTLSRRVLQVRCIAHSKQSFIRTPRALSAPRSRQTRAQQSPLHDPLLTTKPESLTVDLPTRRTRTTDPLSPLNVHL